VRQETSIEASDSADLPKVSVVVPVFNDPDGIRGCVAALRRQSYAEGRYQIIVVDNGSTDTTPAVLRSLGIESVVEQSRRGSYAARNAGLRTADGAVVAFTDADCTPGESWIEQGVRAMRQTGAALAGGRVRFRLSPRPRGAEIWDSITNMQVEQGIRERGVGKTANLFVAREVFDAVGPFPDELVSGGDVAWTRRATRHGFHIVYAAEAEVEHPARRLGGLIRKQFRVGKGQAALHADAGDPGFRVVLQILRLLLAPRPSLVGAQLASKEVAAPSTLFVRVWMAAWASRAATGVGIASKLLARRSPRKADG
jgi:glycosyltransferase involved in cell wall biosynthesis